MLKPNERVPYVTRRYHEGYPAGQKCLAWRDEKTGALFLEFEDGKTICPGCFYLRGIERSLFGDAVEDIIEQADAEALAEIQRSIDSLNA